MDGPDPPHQNDNVQSETAESHTETPTDETDRLDPEILAQALDETADPVSESFEALAEAAEQNQHEATAPQDMSREPSADETMASDTESATAPEPSTTAENSDVRGQLDEIKDTLVAQIGRLTDLLEGMAETHERAQQRAAEFEEAARKAQEASAHFSRAQTETEQAKTTYEQAEQRLAEARQQWEQAQQTAAQAARRVNGT